MTIYDEIKKEREYQDEKWGGAEHDDKHSTHDFLTFIAGYHFKAIGEPQNVRKRLIQIAALSIAAVESYDRKNK